MNLIAFDLGGSSGKLFLGQFSGNQITLKELHRFAHAAIPMGKSLFWDFTGIYKNLCDGILKAIRETGDCIDCFGVDSFCNDFALLSPDGELLTQMHSYRDNRTRKWQPRIYETMSPEALYRMNGNQNAPFNTLMQLAAMKLEGEGALLSDTHFLFLPDLLIYLLSGQKQTEYTLASVSQMFDFGTGAWNPEILRAFDIPTSLFSKILSPGKIRCHTSPDFNQRLGTKGFPIATVCEHDTASAFLAGIENRDCAYISCGTWALLGTETDAPCINEFGFRHNIANEGGFPGGHHRILKNVMGTWLVQEVRASYERNGKSYTFSDLETAAAAALPFAFLIDVDDERFYAPQDMVEEIQSACLEHYRRVPETPGAVIRCIYESLAMKYRYDLQLLEHLTGKKFRVLNMLGGGCNSRMMCQFTANAADLPLIAGPADATAYGNLLVQLIALREISSIEEGRKIVQTSAPSFQYMPENTADWEEQYQYYIEFILQKN